MKSFNIDKEEFAGLAHRGSQDGPLEIDIMMNSITPTQARNLAVWLLKAADYVVAHNKKRKQKAEEEDE